MVFNATCINISALSWQSLLMVEETGVPGENYRADASHWQTVLHNVVLNAPRHVIWCRFVPAKNNATYQLQQINVKYLLPTVQPYKLALELKYVATVRTLRFITQNITWHTLMYRFGEDWCSIRAVCLD